MKHQKTKSGRQGRHSQNGFSIAEVLISMVVLSVGLISLLAVFGIALVSTQVSQEDMVAKQLASEAMENIFTARDTVQVDPVLGRAIVFDDLQNAPSGIFVTGQQAINQPGADGIIGTADDGPIRTLAIADPDGVLRGKTQSLANFKRQITIADVAGQAAVRSITIVVTYTTPRSPLPRTYTLSGYISQYR
jgi:prepilin-type N-terminal cleavage/methylation domain-containing protein